jgi:virginiamycin A acetyltransferase
LNFKKLFFKIKSLFQSESITCDTKSPQLKDFVSRNIILSSNSNISEDSVIGSNTYIGLNCNITKAIIGNYCSIANNVTIGSGEHLIQSVSTSSLFYKPEEVYKILTTNECSIGHDVWIGVDSIIRRGVKIGNGAIVGANSFVNKDVPDFAIVAGSPAKIIRYRFNELQIQHLNESKWWLLPLENAKIKVFELEKKISNLAN